MNAMRPDMVLDQPLPWWTSKLFVEHGDRPRQHNIYIMIQKGSRNLLLANTCCMREIRETTTILGYWDILNTIAV